MKEGRNFMNLYPKLAVFALLTGLPLMSCSKESSDSSPKGAVTYDAKTDSLIVTAELLQQPRARSFINSLTFTGAPKGYESLVNFKLASSDLNAKIPGDPAGTGGSLALMCDPGENCAPGTDPSGTGGGIMLNPDSKLVSAVVSLVKFPKPIQDLYRNGGITLTGTDPGEPIDMVIKVEEAGVTLVGKRVTVDDLALEGSAAAPATEELKSKASLSKVK